MCEFIFQSFIVIYACACPCLHVHLSAGVFGGQKRVLDSLELEFGGYEAPIVGAGPLAEQEVPSTVNHLSSPKLYFNKTVFSPFKRLHILCPQREVLRLPTVHASEGDPIN